MPNTPESSPETSPETSPEKKPLNHEANTEPGVQQALFFEHSGQDPGSNLHTASETAFKVGLKSTQTESAMTIFSHLTELRRRIIVCLISLTGTVMAGFFWAKPVISIFQALAPETVVFVQRAPGEVLICSLMVALFLGSALASPVILYQLFSFVLPGLLQREKKWLLGLVFFGTLLFLAGVIFSYYWVLPVALLFLIDFGQTIARPELSIQLYIGFCLSLMFTTGALFELPMVLFALSVLRIVTSQKLITEWRWALIIIGIVAAIVTPTQDPLSMSIIALPMILLYALSIIMIRASGY
ncbi:MAG: twin-arginine translocase subunit TatC [Cyanobacteria bacterium P01_H01_bin.74]